MKEVRIHFDGACHNMPNIVSPMGLGIAVFEDGEYCEITSRAIGVEEYQGDGTSNIAEWLALVEALKIAVDYRKENPDLKISIFGDSQLIVNQFNLIWKINEEKFLPLFKEAKILNVKARIGEIHWVKREYNTQADKLSKQGLKILNKSEKDLCLGGEKRYCILGVHDESETEWVEFETNDLELAKRRFSITGSVNEEMYYFVDRKTGERKLFLDDGEKVENLI